MTILCDHFDDGAAGVLSTDGLAGLLDEWINWTGVQRRRCRRGGSGSSTAQEVPRRLVSETARRCGGAASRIRVRRPDGGRGRRETGVPGATANDLFTSKNELIVEICLRRIHDVALSTDGNHGSIARVVAQLSQVMLVVAEEPAVATACAAVFLDDGPTAERAHEQIGLEIHRLIATAVGPGSWPEVITTLELVFSGALIQAAAGAMTFQRAADRVQTAVSLILEGVPQY